MSYLKKVLFYSKIVVVSVFFLAIAYVLVFMMMDANIVVAWIEMQMAEYGQLFVLALATTIFAVGFAFAHDLEAMEIGRAHV